MNYQIIENGQVKKEGWARGRQHIDPTYFTKTIISVNGSVEWEPVDVPRLTLNSQIPIEYSDPKFSFEEASVFEQMLNDHVG